MDRRESITRSRSADGYSFKDAFRGLCRGAFFGACAYFAGSAELPFGARPFGVALLSASKKEAPLVYLGLVISAFNTLDVDEAIIYFAIYTALLLMRVFSRIFVELRGDKGVKIGARRLFEALFGEKVGLRVLSSAIFGVALGISMLFAGGLLYYDLFGLLIISLISPLTTFLLCGFVEGKNKENMRNELLYLLGLFALCGISVFGAREVTVYGVSLSVAFAMIVTFYVTRRYGLGYGSIGGLALGLCYSPLLSPIFVASALCMGILARFSVSLACFTAFFTACAWSFYVQGMSALLGAFGGILSACLLYSVIDKTVLFKDNVKEKNSAEKNTTQVLQKCEVMPDSALDGVRLFEMNARMSAMSDGLYKLSLLFDELKSEDICFQNNQYCAENYNSDFFTDISAPEYRALSALLTKTVESETGEYFTDKELSKRLCHPLSELKLDIFGVLVYGVRKKTIYIKGRDKEILLQNARYIIEALAPLLPFAVSFENFDVRRDGEKGGSLFIFERERNSASVVRRRVTAQGEETCGDSTAVFKNKDDRFFAFISDGMGSGSRARAVSEISVGFLCNMLSTGKLDKELANMLNGFLCTRLQKNISECSATLDLFELDLMNGHASFYKCGAAPSYIFRHGRLFKLRSDSLPIGILNDVDMKIFDLDLSVGDIIVMMSDGVTGEGSECPWLFDLLAQNLPNRSLERTADLIVKYATAKGSYDDITVLLVRVE